MNTFIFCRPLLGIVLGAALALPAARAQTPTTLAETTGAISRTGSMLTGQVSSAQGEVQPKAVVSVISLATSLRRSDVANESGNFVIDGMVPGGPYVVQVQQPGFRTQNITNVFLKAGEATVLTVALNPETVAV